MKTSKVVPISSLTRKARLSMTLKPPRHRCKSRRLPYSFNNDVGFSPSFPTPPRFLHGSLQLRPAHGSPPRARQGSVTSSAALCRDPDDPRAPESQGRVPPHRQMTTECVPQNVNAGLVVCPTGDSRHHQQPQDAAQSTKWHRLPKNPLHGGRRVARATPRVGRTKRLFTSDGAPSASKL